MLKSKVLLLFLLTACVFTACKNDPAYDAATQLAIDEDIIVAKLKADGQTATRTNEGLYYQLIKASADTKPVSITNLLDTVSIHYVARIFTTQVLYDSTANDVDTIATKVVLGNTIEGWQKGIPLMKTGDRIRLIVPSPLAYQNRIIGTLPANTILDFDIKLISTSPQKIVTTK